MQFQPVGSFRKRCAQTGRNSCTNEIDEGQTLVDFAVINERSTQRKAQQHQHAHIHTYTERQTCTLTLREKHAPRRCRRTSRMEIECGIRRRGVVGAQVSKQTYAPIAVPHVLVVVVVVSAISTHTWSVHGIRKVFTGCARVAHSPT